MKIVSLFVHTLTSKNARAKYHTILDNIPWTKKHLNWNSQRTFECENNFYFLVKCRHTCNEDALKCSFVLTSSENQTKANSQREIWCAFNDEKCYFSHEKWFSYSVKFSIKWRLASATKRKRTFFFEEFKHLNWLRWILRKSGYFRVIFRFFFLRKEDHNIRIHRHYITNWF